MHLNELKIQADLFPTDDLYPFNLEVLRQSRSLSFGTRVTFFVGENGSGKSTLLTAIARKANYHIWQGFKRTKYAKNRYEERLHQYIALRWQDGAVPGAFFASEMFRNFSQLLDEWASTDPGVLYYFGNSSLMNLSHGQSHMAFFESRFKIEGLYLLDEPENALSPKSQLRLLRILEETEHSDKTQFVIATHSPILLSLESAEIVSFDHAPVRKVDYKNTEHYTVYRDFFKKYDP